MILIIIVLPLFIIRSCSVETEEIPHEAEQEKIKIQVFISKEDIIKEMDLEEYVKGVVAAEMPAEFGIEALKAQAVAARTYAVGRMKKIYVPKEDTHNGAHICTDFSHCQAWISKDEAINNWGIAKGRNYWRKIEKAVSETESIIITYENRIINPLYHSNSGGKTENASEVWGGEEVPYLKSVVSRGEESNPFYKATIRINIEDFYSTIESKYPDIEFDSEDILSSIEILEYTTGGRVKTIEIGSIQMKGTEFRQLFSLRSANFTIDKINENIIEITTIGNGHGVGMSQWGANYLSKNGCNFEEIIKYYYSDVKLQKIKNH